MPLWSKQKGGLRSLAKKKKEAGIGKGGDLGRLNYSTVIKNGKGSSTKGAARDGKVISFRGEEK